jgi:adenylate cyclase
VQDSDLTLINSKPQGKGQSSPLRLLYETRETVLSPGDNDCVVGRDADCGIVVETAYASRHHCTVTWQHDKFVLKDHSSNGTWLQLGRAEPLHVHHETVPLTGAGSIKIGQAFGDDATGLILFKI